MKIDNKLILILASFTVFIGLHIINKGKILFMREVADEVTVISSIFITISVYLTYQVFNEQLVKMSADSTFHIIDRSLLNINKLFVDFYNECPNFINSLYFDWQKKILGEVNIPKIKDKWYVVNYISIAIFQSWEDFFTAVKIDETDTNAWINIFLQWTHSFILYKNWNVLKTNYDKTTQKFGDFLFYMSQNNKINNPKELNQIGLTIVNSNLFNTILNERHNI